MWSWLNTAGANFIQPSDSFQTNYLTGFTGASMFKVRRATEGRPAPRRSRINDRSGDSETADSKALEETAVDDSASSAQKILKAREPFPLNPDFKSEAILSEELRLEIWKRVQVYDQSVRQVSADLNVEMRRVGAVVRLVEVEKRMRAEVCQRLFLALAHRSMMPSTISLSDFHHGA